MRWAIIAHQGQWIKGRLIVPPKVIAEACVPAAVAQGWIVLARDSEVPVTPMALHLHSNPRRHRRRGLYGTHE